jgi:hypothetical protein
MIRALLAALVLLPLGAAAQTMYKWVDDKGVTHYSETAPPDVKAKPVDVTPTGKAAPASDDWRRKEEESRQRKAVKDSQEGEVKRREDADRGRRCRYAQSELDLMKNSRRVYHLDAKGERVYVDDGDRPVLIEKWTAEVRKNCD